MVRVQYRPLAKKRLASIRKTLFLCAQDALYSRFDVAVRMSNIPQFPAQFGDGRGLSICRSPFLGYVKSTRDLILKARALAERDFHCSKPASNFAIAPRCQTEPFVFEAISGKEAWAMSTK